MSRTTCRRFASLILGITIPLLQSTFELAVDGGQIIVRQFPHFSLTFPLTSFQFPSTRFQSMAIRECANA
jgi:hypothetical protein